MAIFYVNKERVDIGKGLAHDTPLPGILRDSIAPANALAAATGERLRVLPLSLAS